MGRGPRGEKAVGSAKRLLYGPRPMGLGPKPRETAESYRYVAKGLRSLSLLRGQRFDLKDREVLREKLIEAGVCLSLLSNKYNIPPEDMLERASRCCDGDLEDYNPETDGSMATEGQPMRWPDDCTEVDVTDNRPASLSEQLLLRAERALEVGDYDGDFVAVDISDTAADLLHVARVAKINQEDLILHIINREVALGLGRRAQP